MFIIIIYDYYYMNIYFLLQMYNVIDNNKELLNLSCLALFPLNMRYLKERSLANKY